MAAIIAKVRMYAKRGTLKTPENLHSQGKHFFAIKVPCGARAYCWRDGDFLVISHFILKKKDKLAEKDQKLMQENYESHGYTDLKCEGCSK